jgi:hypothetical protein
MGVPLGRCLHIHDGLLSRGARKPRPRTRCAPSSPRGRGPPAGSRWIVCWTCSCRRECSLQSASRTAAPPGRFHALRSSTSRAPGAISARPPSSRCLRGSGSSSTGTSVTSFAHSRRGTVQTASRSTEESRASSCSGSATAGASSPRLAGRATRRALSLALSAVVHLRARAKPAAQPDVRLASRWGESDAGRQAKAGKGYFAASETRVRRCAWGRSFGAGRARLTCTYAPEGRALGRHGGGGGRNPFADSTRRFVGYHRHHRFPTPSKGPRCAG